MGHILPLEQGTYKTPSGKSNAVARAFPNLCFYTRAIGEVIKASGKSKRGQMDPRVLMHHSLSVLDALERTGVDIEITGLDNIVSFDGPCVVVANHMSTLETFTLPGIISPLKEITFVIKESLANYPVFGRILVATKAIRVGRVNPRDDLKTVMHEGVESLKSGTSIVIFPQTTRIFGFDREKFNSLGIKLALKAGVPVVPLALRTDAWARGRIVKDLGRIDASRPVRFAFGEPMEIQGRGNDEHLRCMEFIESKLRQWDVI